VDGQISEVWGLYENRVVHEVILGVLRMAPVDFVVGKEVGVLRN